MTRQEFKAFREYLCLSQQELADEWNMGVHGARTIRRWEAGERPLNPVAAYCIALMADSRPQYVDGNGKTGYL